MTEQVTVNDIASMFKAQPQPEPVEESTGGTDEAEVLESQPVEADYSDYEDDDYEVDAEGSIEGDDVSDDDDGSEYVTVNDNGEEVQTTKEEADAGYLRDKDYRQKTMKLAEQRKAVEAKTAELDSTIAELKSFIKGEEDNTDWEALQDQDPREYIRRTKALEQAKAAQAKAEAERTQQLTEQRTAIVQAEAKRLEEAMGPTWVGEQRNKDMALASEYLRDMGVSEDEVSTIVDHRIWRMIFDAAKSRQFSDTKSAVSKEVKKTPKSVKPGQKLSSSERRRREANKRIQSGNRNEQINALKDLFKQG